MSSRRCLAAAVFLPVLWALLVLPRQARGGDESGDAKDAEIRMLRASAKHQAEEIEPLRRQLADAQRKLGEAEGRAADAAAAARVREADLLGQIAALNKRIDELSTQLAVLKKERAATVARAETQPASDQPIREIPLVGDEASLAAVRADPKSYIDKTITLCGGLRTGDGSEGYSRFFFQEMLQHSRPGEFIRLYIARKEGGELADIVAQTEHRTGGLRLMRLKVMVRLDAFRVGYVWTGEAEIIDWQPLARDRKTWGPWHSEGKAEAGTNRK